MYTNDNLEPIHENQQYISADGQYPANFPKSDIPNIYPVVTSADPTSATVIATGYVIEKIVTPPDLTDPENPIYFPDVYNQVWQSRAKTQDEIDAEVAIARTAKKLEIELSYAAVAFAPIMFTAAGSTSKSYNADSNAMTAIVQVLTLTGETPPGFYWRLADNSREEPFLKSDVQGLADTIGNRNIPYFQNRSDKKDAIDAATTVAAVNVITW